MSAPAARAERIAELIAGTFSVIAIEYFFPPIVKSRLPGITCSLVSLVVTPTNPTLTPPREITVYDLAILPLPASSPRSEL